MKPNREWIDLAETQPGWQLLDRRVPQIPFQWHFHPQYELTLTLNSVGKRYVADSVEPYGHGDLVLLGPELPHTWQSERQLDPSLPHQALVVWWNQAWVDRLCKGWEEFAAFDTLFIEARQGLCFASELGERVAPMLLQLDSLTEPRRTLRLLEILEQLRLAPRRPVLDRAHRAPALGEGEDCRSLRLALDAIARRFQEPIRLEELAAAASVSSSTLNRLFQKHLNQSVKQYLVQLRLHHACQLLGSSRLPINLIAEQAGFGNLANFNQLFLKYRGCSPREFRRQSPNWEE